MVAENMVQLWPAFTFAAICAVITISFSIYMARKGPLPSQAEALNDLKEKYDKQQMALESLTDQSARQWVKMQQQERELIALRARNTILEKTTREQDALIAALQRQLIGLARDDLQTGKRLRAVLTQKMTEEELRQWAFDIDVPFENLRGDTTPALVVSMLEYLERHGKLAEGLEELRKIRPDIMSL